MTRKAGAAKAIKALARIEATKQKIAKLRDQLRLDADELGDVLDSLDEGIEYISDGQRMIEDGVAEMSKYL